MSVDTSENVTYRTGFIKRPDRTTVIIRAGYSVICEIEGRPGVVLKVPLPFAEYDEAMEIEKRVYRRLGKHPNIVNVIETNEWGIYLERAEPDASEFTIRREVMLRLKKESSGVEMLPKSSTTSISTTFATLTCPGRILLLDSARNILLCDLAVLLLIMTKPQSLPKLGSTS